MIQHQTGSRYARPAAPCLGLLVVLLLITSHGKAAPQPELRTWTDRTGGFQIQAVLLNFKDGKVHLKRKDGRAIAVPIDKLSRADQDWVRRRTEVVLEPVELVADPKRRYRFSNGKTGDSFTGTILDNKIVNGRWLLSVETSEGKRMFLVVTNQWRITLVPEKPKQPNRHDGPDAGQPSVAKKDAVQASPKAGNAEPLAQPDSSKRTGGARQPKAVAPGNVVEFNIPASKASRKTPGVSPGGNVVEVDFGDPKLKPQAGSQVRQVLVTGVGLVPEKAVQNAFSRAIEQTVGVLVDAETLVENDEIIRDKVLTHSCGFVEKFDVLKRWEADGLHHAQIRVAVAAEKLVESLRSHNIAMREVEGWRMSLQLKHEVASEEDAAEMFARIMEDYTIDKLFRVEILGKPEVVEKDQVAAKLVVPLRLTPDWENWKRLHDKLEALLRRVATKRSAFSTLPRQAEMNEECWIALEREVAMDMERRLADAGGPAIALLKSRNRTGGVTSWDIFRVPDSSGGIADILNRLKARQHRVRLVLLDANEQPVLEERMKLKVMYSYNNGSIVGYHNTCDGLCHFGVRAYWLAPLFWQEDGIRYRFVYEPCKVTIRVELDRLGKVAKCVAFAEIDQ